MFHFNQSHRYRHVAMYNPTTATNLQPLGAICGFDITVDRDMLSVLGAVFKNLSTARSEYYSTDRLPLLSRF
jgi:hypothetical protein